MTDNRTWRGSGLCKNLLQAAFAALLAPASLFAEIPKTVPVYSFVQVTLNPDETALVIRDGLLPVETIETKDGIAFTGPPGRYLVALITPGRPTPDNNFVEIVGVTPPIPVDPPKPPVDPPVDPPKPDTATAPLPDVPGFRVLMIYESGTLPPDIPKEQHEIPYLPTVRDWLTKNTTPEAGWAGWRVGDPQSVPQTSNVWARMLALPRTEVPWLIVNNGDKKVGYSGPMPKNATDFMKLVEGLK